MRVKNRWRISFVASLLGGMIVTANAAETVGADKFATLESLDPRFDALIAPDTKIEKIADDLLWSEGPLWDPRGKVLLFSDIPRNRVMQWHADKGVTVFLENSGYTGAAPFTGREPGSNGLTFDLQGRLPCASTATDACPRAKPMAP
jgi:gluconolactonase